MATRKFFQIESKASAVLLISIFATLLFANIAPNTYQPFTNNVQHFVNSYLIAIFFMAVGQELRPELNKKLALPAFAALGGMIFPALIFKLLNDSQAWVAALPTDIALVIGAVSLLGQRVRSEVRIFILALAISDDLLSILFISAENISHLSALATTLGGAIIGIFLPAKYSLQKISEFFVVPIFILVNFGFELIAPNETAFALGFSRLIGKTLGITLFAVLAAKIFKVSQLSYREFLGVGALAGMGLTVAIYLAQLTGGLDMAQIKLGLGIGIILSFLLAWFLLQNPMAKKTNQ